jgi:cyclase
MQNPRVIPVLLLHDGGLVKTVKFKKPIYIGDPINAVRIFNVKEVDELVLLDIDATSEGREPNYDHIKEIVSEAFMPIGYGGGIKTLGQIEKLFNIGVEKIILNTAAFSNSALITEAANIYGNQSIVVSIDVKKDMWGDYKVYGKAGTEKQKGNLTLLLKEFQELGAGEIFLNSIDNDGMMSGYDITLIEKAVKVLDIPLVAIGGAGQINDLSAAIKAGASAVAAGSIFVFQGIHRAVLISYIKSEELNKYSKD